MANQVKNTSNFTNQDRGVTGTRDYLLQESGSFLLLESGGQILIKITRSFDNFTKSVSDWANQSKS